MIFFSADESGNRKTSRNPTAKTPGVHDSALLHHISDIRQLFSGFTGISAMCCSRMLSDLDADLKRGNIKSTFKRTIKTTYTIVQHPFCGEFQ